MSAVHFLDPVDYISGKISKKFRTVYNRRRASDKRYTQVPGSRTTPFSHAEIERQTKFRYVAAAVKARKMDLMAINDDQTAYIDACKNPNFKYHTYNGWLFGRAWKGYNSSTHEVTW
jgi:hypothetical protein